MNKLREKMSQLSSHELRKLKMHSLSREVRQLAYGMLLERRRTRQTK